MNVTDPIADLLTRIRNGQQTGHEVIAIPASKLKIAIAHLLREEGFIRNYRCVRDGKQGLLKLALKFDDEGRGVIREIKRVSKSSRRCFVKSGEIPYVKNGFGTAILSTSKGLMTGRDARKLNIGGEYLCSVF
tara:strand:- start:120 stop:518 length:399 start_codon:yes stop_codon:yes gene_type:complete